MPSPAIASKIAGRRKVSRALEVPACLLWELYCGYYLPRLYAVVIDVPVGGGP
ncbi:hypothetical protein D082_23100 [Synechocystis sp. PCC 6714]|nr:hypothetical protein D082_23100 [Synechocystis sp. PCC 6714]